MHFQNILKKIRNKAETRRGVSVPLAVKLAAALLVILNIFIIKNLYVGLFSFILFILLTGKDFALLYKVKFKNLEFPYIFGAFTSVFLLLFLCSVFILFYKITPEIIAINLIIILIISLFLNFKFKNSNIKNEEENNTDNTLKDFKLRFSYLIPIGIFLFSYFILNNLILFKFKDHIVNYFWRNSNFIIFIFVFSIIAFLMFLIFTEKNKKYILFFIIFVSFVVHSNVPIYYDKANGGAGDRYRFLANEEILRDKGIVKPSLFGTKEDVTIKTIGPIKIPEVLVSGNKQSYINKWGVDIILSYVLNVDISKIDIWINFILWSLFIPFIFFNIFKLLLNNEKLALLFSSSSLLLNIFQFNGSVSYPIGINFILFLFLIMLFISKIKDNIKIDKDKIILILSTTILLYFNYIAFLFLWIVLLFIYFSQYFIEKLNIKVYIKKILICISIALSSFLFLFLDIKMKFANINFSSIPKNLLSFSSKFLSPTTIPNVTITMPRFIYFAPLLSLIFFIIVGFGVYFFYKKNKEYKYILYFFISICLSYIYCWTILDGDKIFSRKIGMLVIFFFLFFLIYGIYFIFSRYNNLNINKKEFIIISIIIFLSSIGTLQYASGPVIELNMNYDLDSFKYVYDKVKNDEHPCVIGDTIHTILLEYISKNKLIAGGFPQVGNYVQSDRSRIFNEMLKNPDKKYLEEAEKITGSDNCVLITDNRNVDHYHLGSDATETFINRHKVFDQITDIFGNNKPFREIMMFYK